ncbi:MAG: metal ABC transporter substrate-binding protein [Armatimonadota bacterium]
MKAIIKLIILFSIFAFVFSGCASREQSKSSDKLLVVTSIPPLADFCRNVGGSYVEVTALVPTGQSVHTFELRPDQMELISKADVLVLNGVELEFWAHKAIEASGNKDLIVVDTSEKVDIIFDETEHEHEKHSDSDVHGHVEDEGCCDHIHTAGNPHIWLDPVIAKEQVIAIRDAFIKANPNNRDAYIVNADNYISQLEKLDKDIREEVSSFTNKNFIAFHSAWVYFAKRYGLNQAAVVMEREGVEPSPAEIKELIDLVKKLDAKAIFAEPQFSPKAAETIANEAGIKVLFLDPLGENYIETMRENIKQMSEAMK